MSEAEINALTAADLKQVAGLWNEVFQGAYLRAHLTEPALRAATLDADTFDPDGSFVAREESRLLGVVLSFAQRAMETDGWWHTIIPGWIGAIFVRGDARRRGIGRRLLSRAGASHQERGRLLLFTGGGENILNFFPGLEDRWEEAQRFFRACDYAFVRRTCYVDVDLNRHAQPERVQTRIEKLRAEGIWIEPAHAALAEMYRRYAKEAGGEATYDALPDDPDGLVVARTEDRVIGEVSEVGGHRGGKGGFGMIQTLDEFRNRGIGTVLLAAAVERCKELGAVSMPLWTRPQTAERFYQKVGYEVVRNYDVYAKVLAQDFLTEEWIARYRYV